MSMFLVLLQFIVHVICCLVRNNNKLQSTGYSALPSPPRLMRRTHTHTAWRTPSNTIPSLLA